MTAKNYPIGNSVAFQLFTLCNVYCASLHVHNCVIELNSSCRPSTNYQTLHTYQIQDHIVCRAILAKLSQNLCEAHHL